MLVKLGAIAAAVLTVASPALAVQVPAGKAGLVTLFSPTVVTSTSPATASFFGPTFEIFGTDGFSAIGGTFGSLSGTLSFSSVVGTTLSQSVSNFFTFDDAFGGSYSFSVSSVLTQSYAISPGVSQSFSLYLLGTTADANLGYAPTPTSLTLTFNQTGKSAFSASGTLAIPPELVPEPASWLMMIAGFGMTGAALRSRRATRVHFG